MGDHGVVVSARAKMNDVPYARNFGDIQKRFALPEHINGVSRHHENDIDILHGGSERFYPVKIKMNQWDVQK